VGPPVWWPRSHLFAGALSIALACDLIVASEDATFGRPRDQRRRLSPSWGMRSVLRSLTSAHAFGRGHRAL